MRRAPRRSGGSHFGEIRMSRPAPDSKFVELTGQTARPSRAKAGYVVAPGRPKFPAEIRAKSGSEAKRSFKRLVRMLLERRALTPGDQELLRLYAHLFARHQRALEKLAAEGEVVEYTRLN